VTNCSKTRLAERVAAQKKVSRRLEDRKNEKRLPKKKNRMWGGKKDKRADASVTLKKREKEESSKRKVEKGRKGEDRKGRGRKSKVCLAAAGQLENISWKKSGGGSFRDNFGEGTD